MLEKEFKYYLKHQDDLVAKYPGKFLVIKDDEVKGAYDTMIEAYTEGLQKFEPGTFLIQECLPGNENYTLTFHSRRVTFANEHHS